ncbi:MAG: DUF3881 family protein [Roseburia sp.]|nr:DUF3881 family protein [Roseburia sp.]
MHKYLRAIGFSSVNDRNKLKDILTDTIMNSDERAYTMNTENVLLGEFCKDFAENMGIAVCGEFDDEDKFVYEYYYPYLKGTGITSREDISVERHADKDSYAGVCDDMNVGISLIFYLRNMISYVKAQAAGKLPVRGTSVTMSALSVSGNVILPIQKDEKQKDWVKRRTIDRNKLLDAARKGNEDAMETLTLEDMDIYSSISARIQNEDVFSIVDTYFMPYGVECDQYSVLGEILSVKTTVNQITGEKIYLLTICCNELTFDVCINIIDLFGEPQVGRRFKGIIWLQGFINFPEE